MAVRGRCVHCESDQATVQYVITGENEEGFCCDRYCFDAHFKQIIVRALEKKRKEYVDSIDFFKKMPTLDAEFAPFAAKYKRVLVLSSNSFDLLLKRDADIYRLFKQKCKDEWVELLDLSPNSEILKGNADRSLEWFELCKTSERYFFPRTTF